MCWESLYNIHSPLWSQFLSATVDAVVAVAVCMTVGNCPINLLSVNLSAYWRRFMHWESWWQRVWACGHMSVHIISMRKCVCVCVYIDTSYHITTHHHIWRSIRGEGYLCAQRVCVMRAKYGTPQHTQRAKRMRMCKCACARRICAHASSFTIYGIFSGMSGGIFGVIFTRVQASENVSKHENDTKGLCGMVWCLLGSRVFIEHNCIQCTALCGLCLFVAYVNNMWQNNAVRVEWLNYWIIYDQELIIIIMDNECTWFNKNVCLYFVLLMVR